MTIQELINQLQEYDSSVIVHIGTPDYVQVLEIENIKLDTLMIMDGTNDILVFETD